MRESEDDIGKYRDDNGALDGIKEIKWLQRHSACAAHALPFAPRHV